MARHELWGRVPRTPAAGGLDPCALSPLPGILASAAHTFGRPRCATSSAPPHPTPARCRERGAKALEERLMKTAGAQGAADVEHGGKGVVSAAAEVVG